MEGTVLLTGASGLLGTWLRRRAPGGADVVGVIHRTPLPADAPQVSLDLRDVEATASAVARIRPALVVHAAYTQDEPSIVEATRNVVEAAAAVGAEVLFISTDAVFCGDGRRRSETDAPDPIWDYGRWKAQAEAVVSRSPVPSTIVRLPLLVSLDPDDHVVSRIRTAAGNGEPMSWFDDEIRQPASAEDVAEALWRIAALDAGARAGTWHLPGPELLTRHQIAVRVAVALGLDPDLIRPEPTPPGANRPRSLHLLDERARRAVGWMPAPVLHRTDEPPTS